MSGVGGGVNTNYSNGTNEEGKEGSAFLIRVIRAIRVKGLNSISPALWQTALLFAIDMVTNATDYGFHIFLGRRLPAAEFAAVQSVNALVLILVATFSVLQPVIARYAAAHEDAMTRGYFQKFSILSGMVGVGVMGLLVLFGAVIAAYLNVPPLAIRLLAGMGVVVCVRPVLVGLLQGRGQYLQFGLVRTAFAFGRILFAIVLIALFGRTATSAVAAYPLAGLLSVGVAGLFLGKVVWQVGGLAAEGTERAEKKRYWGYLLAIPKDNEIREGVRLSLAAFVAYAAFMSLQNIDLIWGNRLFSAEMAGNYATAAVLRRVLAVLPGAVTVILYPRIVAQIKQGALPDKLLGQAVGLIALPTLVLGSLYIWAGAWIMQFVFGATFVGAQAILGWFAVAMLGFGIATVWLNLYLATRPWVFVVGLALLAMGQVWLFSAEVVLTPLTAARYFAFSGWAVALLGSGLYLFWLRPAIAIKSRWEHDRQN